MGSVRAGGWIAIGLSLALVVRVVLINNPEAITVIAPAMIGGIAVVRWPPKRWVLIAALVLIGATATYSLFGGIGLLYIPSFVLIVGGALRPRRTAHSQP
jgi:hypothetical protein